jgi:hypothetical protein
LFGGSEEVSEGIALPETHLHLCNKKPRCSSCFAILAGAQGAGEAGGTAMRPPRLFSALLVLLISATLLSAPPSHAATPGFYAGTWTGTTSQGLPLSFTVTGDAITRIEARFRIGICTITTTVTASLPISGDSFSGSLGNQGINGTFTAADTAAGTGFYTSTNPACLGTATVSWNATRPATLASISGTVRDTNGAPLEGVQLTATPTQAGQSPVTAQSAADGSYTLNVPAGTYSLVAAKPQYRPAQRAGISVPPNTAGIDLVLAPEQPAVTGAIRGTLRTPSGSPLAGAQILATPLQGGASPATAETGADGGYTLSLPAGDYTLRATKAEYQPREVQASAPQTGESVVDLVLSPVVVFLPIVTGTSVVVQPTPIVTPTPGTSLKLDLCSDAGRNYLATPCNRTAAVQYFFYPPYSSREFEYPLTGDIRGNLYSFNLWMASSGTTTFNVTILLRRGGTDTVLASTSFAVSAGDYEQFTRTIAGIDPASASGDTLVLRIETPSGARGGLVNGAAQPSFITVPAVQ